MQKFFDTYGIDDPVIAAGVSGGADSLALVLRLQDWAQENGRRIVALTVNHGLRPEAGEESAYVAQLMKRRDIEHHTLLWEGEKPQTGIENAARKARYELLFGWCRQNNVRVLATGHHRRDQAETFLLRLQRGSGLYGLCGISPVSVREGITVIRPQLDKDPEELRNWLKSCGISWAEDASNQCEDFMRVRMRKFLPELEKAVGISEQRLAETAAILARTREYLEFECQRFIENSVRFYDGCVAGVKDTAAANWHPELGFRVMGQLIRQIGGQDYPPEAEELRRLLQAVKSPGFGGCTLGGCEIIYKSPRLWIIPEMRVAAPAKNLMEKFLQSHPQYDTNFLPYKVRRALYENWMKKQNGKSKEK